jgi:hypothetical protein
MFGADAIEKAMEGMSTKTAAATIEGIERGAKILGDIIAAKMDELHERDKKTRENEELRSAKLHKP